MLKQHFPQIMDTHFTAQMEKDLDQIAHGNLNRDKLLLEFYDQFEKNLKEFVGDYAKKQSEPTDIPCPECNQDNLLIRFGKSGAFLGCSQFPKCTFTSSFTRDESGFIELKEPEQPVVLEKTCPQCNKPLRQIQGKFGPFTACTGYPECKYIEPVKARFKCLSCKKGDVIQRIWKGNKFWGCSTYPTCKFTIPGDIQDTPCPECKKPYVMKKTDKTGTITLYCSDKECTYKSQI